MSILTGDKTAFAEISALNGNLTTGAPTAGSTVAISCEQVGTVTIQVQGTWTGTLIPQVTTDGLNWVTQAGNNVLQNMATGAGSNSIASTSTGIWQIEVNGHQQFRISSTISFAGLAQVTLRATAGTSQVISTIAGSGLTAAQVQGNVASAATDSGNPVKIGGKFNSTVPTFSDGQRGDAQIDSRGNLHISLYQQGTATPVDASASNSDGLNGAVTGLFVRSYQYVSNGTTDDRFRSVVGAANTQGTGAAAVGLPLWSTTDLTRILVNTAASGDTSLVAAVAAQTIRVHRLRLSVAGAVIAKLTDGASGTVLEKWNFAGNGGAVIYDLSDRPYCKGTANTALVLNLSAAVQVDGVVEYIQSA